MRFPRPRRPPLPERGDRVRVRRSRRAGLGLLFTFPAGRPRGRGMTGPTGSGRKPQPLARPGTATVSTSPSTRSGPTAWTSACSTRATPTGDRALTLPEHTRTSGTAISPAWARARSTASALTGLRPEAGPPLQPHQAPGGPLRARALRQGRLRAPGLRLPRREPPSRTCRLDDRDNAPGCRGSWWTTTSTGRATDSPRTPGRGSSLRAAREGLHHAAPGSPRELRGTYAGLAHPAAIAHLQQLGVTAVELLPVHESVDEGFLEDKGLTNYWGYNTLGYFAPDAALLLHRARAARSTSSRRW